MNTSFWVLGLVCSISRIFFFSKIFCVLLSGWHQLEKLENGKKLMDLIILYDFTAYRVISSIQNSFKLTLKALRS